jgi:hypothetical protein
MSALLEALALLPAGSSELTPEQAVWFAAQLAGIAPAGGAGVWMTWDFELTGEADERASARITLNRRGTQGSAYVVRGARYVDESADNIMIVAMPTMTKNNNRPGALALADQARALAARKGARI